MRRSPLDDQADLSRALYALADELEGPDTHPDHRAGALAAAAMLREVLARQGVPRPAERPSTIVVQTLRRA